jgi:exodeoxyribonuclease VIII
MADLETLGNKPGSAIVALGAVKFGAAGIFDEFYQRIDLQSCLDHGLTMDASTVLWWLKQPDGPRMEITRPGNRLCQVLHDFSEWLGDPNAEIWGNGAAFDNTLLASAFQASGLPLPWKYSNDRCYRTLKALHPEIPMERDGTHHHALDDARSQALHLMRILPNLS